MPDGYRRIIRDHVYDKCWLLDITWAELERLLDDNGEILEETTGDSGRRKQVTLVNGWRRPLHVVLVIDDEARMLVYLTVYEPDLDHWQPGFRKRRS